MDKLLIVEDSCFLCGSAFCGRYLFHRPDGKRTGTEKKNDAKMMQESCKNDAWNM